jgi:hypothetical protein
MLLVIILPEIASSSIVLSLFGGCVVKGEK